MPQFVAPGVYSLESDFSDYAAALQSTSLALVGTASKGPINVPVLCTSSEEFLATFGEPTLHNYGPYAALNYLKQGNQLWYVRIAREFTEEVTTVSEVSVSTPSAPVLTVADASVLAEGDFVRLRQTGKISTIAQISDITGSAVTLNTTLLDTYAADELLLDSSSDSLGASQAEIISHARLGGAHKPIIQFKARDAGAWANFGGKKGVEVVIEDGGQFEALDPITNETLVDIDGVPFRSVLPSSPGKDTAFELTQLTSEDGIRVGETRAVNINSVIGQPIKSTSGSSVVVCDSNAFEVGDTVILVGLTTGNGATTVSAKSITDGVHTLTVAATVGTNNTTQAASGKIYKYSGTLNTVSAVALDTLTLDSTAPYDAGDRVALVGLGFGDGIYEIETVGTGDDEGDLVLTGSTFKTASGSPVGYAWKDSALMKSVVYRCTAVTENGSSWEVVGTATKKVKVLVGGRQVEVFDNIIGYDAESSNFWENVIGTATEPKSAYIVVDYLGTAGEQPMNTYNKVKYPNNTRLLLGVDVVLKNYDTRAGAPDGSTYLVQTTTYKSAKGYDGDNPTTAEYIGIIDEFGYTRTGLQHFAEVDRYDVNLLAVPGKSDASVIEEILAICRRRNDCLGIIDPPLGLSVQEVTDWHNGTGEYTGQHQAFTANQGALYYPWVKQFDPYTNRDIWLPPSAFVPAVIAYTDRTTDVWYAPAGINRGKIDRAQATEVIVTQAHVEHFYGPGNGNAINPIQTFPKDGIVVYGQRTLQRYPSALDRINVRRLLFYIEKVVATATRRLNFEQGDELLWGQFLALVNPFFETLEGQRALEWFKVICDETTNTPQRRNNNEVYARLFLIPIKSAEKFILDFTLLPSGANVNEFIALDNNANTNL